MSRRIVHRWVALLLARRCLGDDAAPAPDRPHVLVLLTDQQRRDSVSAFARATRGPDGAPLTPHLDRLAADGAAFVSAYSSTPTCTPARLALLTGRSPWSHGMLGCAREGARAPVSRTLSARATTTDLQSYCDDYEYHRYCCYRSCYARTPAPSQVREHDPREPAARLRDPGERDGRERLPDRRGRQGIRRVLLPLVLLLPYEYTKYYY